MAKILHTADLHIRKHGDERWLALEELVRIGVQEEIDLLAVSGDLFDRDTDAEQLRDRIREVFTGNGFKVALLPGNHDNASYQAGLYFGEEVIILGDPFSKIELSDAVVWGLPFEQLKETGVVRRLQELSNQINNSQELNNPQEQGKYSHKYHLLLYHGELLDAFFSPQDLGHEEESGYMPAKLSYFEDTGLHHVLAGHFHTNFRVWNLPGGSSFIYPGSPVSITTREKGRRKANLLETGKPPQEISLDTFHYEEIVVELDPLEETDPLETIKSRLKQVHSASYTFLRVTGYFNGETAGLTEQDLVKQIHRLISTKEVLPTSKGTLGQLEVPQVYLQAEFKDIRTILEDPLTQSFLEKLAQRGESREEQKRIRDLTLQAIMEAKG